MFQLFPCQVTDRQRAGEGSFAIQSRKAACQSELRCQDHIIFQNELTGKRCAKLILSCSAVKPLILSRSSALFLTE